MSTAAPVLRVILLMIASILHVGALVLLLREGASVGIVVLLHVLGAVAWGIGLRPDGVDAPKRAWKQPTAWALTFPVLGPIASLAFAAVLRRPPVDRSARRYVVWNDEGEQETSHPPGGAGLSIVEILQSPRTQLRRNAVLALRELDPQMAIPLLRKGLQDSDEQVRIYAQNILSTMLERFEAGIKQLEERLNSNATDPATVKRLAEQYFELVYLDVAGDEETSAHYLAKALRLLERIADSPGADASVAFLGFRYALRARDTRAAKRWIARLSPTEAEAQHVLPWRIELAFLDGDWARLRALFTEFRRAGLINPRIEELGRFWLDPAPAPTATT